MRFTDRRHEDPDINLIPMIDVLLMTLIFLIATTSFSRESQLRIKLPEAAATATAEAGQIRIAIDAQGHYFINDTQVLDPRPDTLRRAMQLAAGRKQDPLVIIYADAKTPHEAVVRAMDAARRLGFVNLTFATRQKRGARE